MFQHLEDMYDLVNQYILNGQCMMLTKSWTIKDQFKVQNRTNEF